MRNCLIIILLILTITGFSNAQPWISIEPDDLVIRGYFVENWRFDQRFPITITNVCDDTISLEIIDLGHLIRIYFPNELRLAPDESWDTFIEVQPLGRLEAGTYYQGAIFRLTEPEEDFIEWVVMIRQLEPPQLRDIDDVDLELCIGEIDTSEIIIANDGVASMQFYLDDEPLDWEIQSGILERTPRSTSATNHQPPYPTRDPAGDLIAIIEEIEGIDEMGPMLPVAYDRANGWMWISDYMNGILYAVTFGFNYQNIEVVHSIHAGNCMEGACLNGNLFISAWGSNQIQRYNPDGQNIGNIQAPFSVFGIASDEDQQRLFLQESGNNYGIHVFSVNEGGSLGEEIGLIDNWGEFNGNSLVYGFEWVQAHQEGQLWVGHRRNGHASQIDVNVDQWQAVETLQEFDTGAQGAFYLAHDGRNLWVSGDNIRIYQDGVNEQQWFRLEPMQGVVVANHQLPISLIIDAWDAGRFESSIYLFTNDPDNLEVEIPICMTVEMPMMISTPDTLNFNSVQAGQSSTLDLLLSLQSVDEDISITGISTETDYFRVQFEERIVISPDDTTSIQVTFHPDSVGEFSDLLIIHTNRHHLPERGVQLSGRGVVEGAATDQDANVIPDQFCLHSVHPNPFNSSTRISYNVSVQSVVNLSIYNTKGQLVDVLVDRVMAAGRHAVVWDGKDNAAGVYLVMMSDEAGGVPGVKKLVMVR